MATRKELGQAIGERYRAGTRKERRQILNEFVRLTGYHRKHAIRVLAGPAKPSTGRAYKRLYDEAVRQSLIVLWEAADRICGKRLKALLPTLIEVMERHGHLTLEHQVKSKLLAISAATIDRLLLPTREQAMAGRRHRGCESRGAGQVAEIRFSAFKYRTTRLVEGKVLYVSPDRLVDRVTNQPYYVAMVEADPASLARAEDIKLLAGMPAEVYIKGETRTPLQYLVEPVTQLLRRAGRER